MTISSLETVASAWTFKKPIRVAAEAADMSRVTLHWIDAGGLQLDLRDPLARLNKIDIECLPERVRLADFPQLKRLAWQLHDVDELCPADA